MKEIVKEATKKRGNLDENGITNLIQKAMKAKAGYDYPGALELFDQAQCAIDKLLSENGADEKKLLEGQYTIHDGRANCYNWMADNNQELSELEIMAGLAAQMGDESRRINVINRQAEAMFGLGEFDEGERLSVEARALAIENGEKDEEAQSLMLLSQIQFQKGETEKSHHNNKQALEIFRETGNLFGQSRCLRNLAFNGMRSGQTENVQQYAVQALDLARQAGDHRSEADSFNVIGNISSDVSQTRDNYKQALEIYTTIGDENGHKRVANNLGLLFWKIGLYGQANYYATRAEMAARALENKKALAVVLDGFGRSWFELGELDRAERAFQEGLILSREYADAFDVAACLMGLARIAHKRGNYQSAIDYFTEQVELLRGKGNVPEIAVVLAWMGAAYLELGDHQQAEQITFKAVEQLLTTNPNTDLLDQEVWWSRYQVLKSGSTSDPEKLKSGEEVAWVVLEKAHRTMLNSIDAISDEGLRRNYLTKVPVNREIIQEWARLFYDRPEFKEFVQHKVTTGNLQEQFKRLSEIGSRLSSQRAPDTLPDFIMNEVVELNGAERAFLAIINSDGDLDIVSLNGLSQDQAEQIVQDEKSLFSQAVDSRYPILKESVGEVPEGEVPELHQRSILVVPLVSQSHVLGVIYTDLRHIFGSFNQNDIDLLTVLANQSASALESANWTRTLEQRVEERTTELGVANTLLEQQNADLAVINEVQQGLAAKLDFQEIIELVGDKLITIFKTHGLSIILYDADSDLCHWAYNHYQGRRRKIDPLPPAGFTGHIIETGKTLVVNEDLRKAAEEYGSEMLTDADWPKSIAYIPILAEGKVIGVIALSNLEEENAFDAASVRLVESLAASLGIALSNVRLFDETNQRAAELAVINSVQGGLAAQLDFDAIIELVGEKIREVFDAQGIGIALYDRQTNIVSSPYFIDDGQRVSLDPVPNPIGFTAHIIETSQPLLVNQDLIHKMEELGSKWVGGNEEETRFSKSYLGVPIFVAGEVIGVISLTNYEREHAYSESDVNLLTTLSSSMSVALENARLFDETNRLLDETQQRNAELTILNSVGDAMARKQDVDTITRIVGDKVRDIFKAEATEILLYDSQNQIITLPYIFNREGYMEREPFNYGEGLTSIVIESRQPLIFGTAEESKKSGAISSIAEDVPTTESYIGVPIIIGERVLGVVSVQSYRKHAYDDSSVRLLSTLAASMGVAIENARLFEEINQRAAELVVINSVQEGLAAELDIQAIYDLVGDSLREVFDAQGAAISIFNHEKGLDFAPYVFELGKRVYLEPHELGEASQYLIKNRKPIKFDSLEEIQKIGGKVIEGTKAEKSSMWAPMVVGETVKGKLSVFNHEEEFAFTDSDLRLLTTLANSTSVALENARLFEETNQRAAELALINSVQEGLAAELEMQAIYDLVGDQIRDIFDAQSVAIFYFDIEQGLSYTPYLFEKGERYSPDPHPLRKIGFHMIETAQPVVINDEADLKKFDMKVVAGEMAKSLIFVPLFAGNQVKGAISLQNIDRENAFSESDVRLLTTLANSMSVALENARLFEETNQRAAELAIINSVGEAMAKQLDVETISRIVGDKVRDIFDAEVTDILLYDKKTDSIKIVYGYDRGYLEDNLEFPFGQGLTSKVIESKQPLVLGSLQEGIDLGANVQPNVAQDDQVVESYMGVPIIVGERVIGVVDVQSYQQKDFNEDSVRLLSTLAANMGVALENARLFQETNRRANETAALNDIGREISATLDQNAVLEQIARRAKEILNAKDVVLRLLQPDGSLPTVVAFGTNEDNFRKSVLRFGEGITGHVVKSGEAEVIASSQADTRASHVAGTDQAEDDTIIFAPLKVRERVIGVMGLWRDIAVAGPFGELDLKFAVGLAGQAAIAIENARLFTEAEQRASEMTALAEVGREISATLDLENVLKRIATRAQDLLNTRTATIRLVEEDGSMPTVVAIGKYAEKHRGTMIQMGEGITGNVAKEGRAEIINDPRDDPRIVHIPGTPEEEDELEAIILAPLMIGERVIGVMGLWRERPVAGPFSEDDLNFLKTLARQAANAIENARLFEEVQRQKLYSEALVKNSPVAIVTHDLDNNIVSWNPAAESLFGYREDEAISVNTIDLISNGSIDEEMSNNFKKGADGGRVKTVTQRFRKDGSPVDVELLSLPVVMEGKQVGLVSIYHDITELLKARHEAEAANDAKSAFLATMSHEIRTPMNGVIGMTSLLLDTELDPEQRDFTETIRNSGEALLTVINDILDFSKIEAGKMELEEQPFDLRDCLESSLDLLKLNASDKGVELAYQMNTDVPSVIVGDITRLRQILINLLNNGLKFTEQGEVVLSVSTEAVPIKKDGPYTLHFSVCDTGIGIPQDRVDRLFQAFSQVDASTSRKYGGTGLGLAISKRLSELMGGEMWVESVEGEGTTFHFTVNAQSGPDLKDREDLKGEQPQLLGKRLLIVDDNLTNRRILTLQTRAWGMLPRDTGDPQEALEWVRQGDPFDLAILDFHMPGMDGVKLSKAIRKAADFPLILFSSISARETAMEEEQFAAFLMKPLKPSVLLDTLMNLFAGEAKQIEPEGGSEKVKLDPQIAERLPLRILLVEDNAVNQKLALRLLEQMGYRADMAGNGLEAIQAIERQKYDLVFMDVQMPEMDGLEASRQICSRWPRGERPRIVAMTANAMQGDRERCLEAGMDDYVSKPIRVEELISALDRTQILE
jgi:PAS domain S-box-containing protein